MSGNPNYLAHGLVAVNYLSGAGFLSSSHFALDVALSLVVNRSAMVAHRQPGTVGERALLCLTWETEQKRCRDALLLLVAWSRMRAASPSPDCFLFFVYSLSPLLKFLTNSSHTAPFPSRRRRSPFWVPPFPGVSSPSRTRYILSH